MGGGGLAYEACRMMPLVLTYRHYSCLNFTYVSSWPPLISKLSAAVAVYCLKLHKLNCKTYQSFSRFQDEQVSKNFATMLVLHFLSNVSLECWLASV